ATSARALRCRPKREPNRPASTSATMKPTLCRCLAYSGPGLPSPTTSHGGALSPDITTSGFGGRFLGRLGLGHRGGGRRLAGRLAHELQRHLDGHLLAAPDDEQVDVVERVLDRIALDRLGQRERRGAVADVDVEDLGHPAVADRGGELARGQRDVARLLAVAV